MVLGKLSVNIEPNVRPSVSRADVVCTGVTTTDCQMSSSRELSSSSLLFLIRSMQNDIICSPVFINQSASFMVHDAIISVTHTAAPSVSEIQIQSVNSFLYLSKAKTLMRTKCNKVNRSAAKRMQQKQRKKTMGFIDKITPTHPPNLCINGPRCGPGALV